VLTPGKVHTHDGVAIVTRGDVLSVVYKAPARLHRSRFIYDAADLLAAKNPEGILCILLVLPTADPPDAPTRAENTARLRKLGPALRMLVTVPIGDMLWMRLVRTIMRGMSIVQGQGARHAITSTVYDGLARLFEEAGPKTPTAIQLEADLASMCRALGAETPPMRAPRTGVSIAP
jgi:hypothetical protein